MKATLNKALFALDAGNTELARAYILLAREKAGSEPTARIAHEATRWPRLDRLESKLTARAEKLHAILSDKPNGISLWDCKCDKRFSALQSLVKFYNEPSRKHPARTQQAQATLERHGFVIIPNPNGKGERLISTRF